MIEKYIQEEKAQIVHRIKSKKLLIDEKKDMEVRYKELVQELKDIEKEVKILEKEFKPDFFMKMLSKTYREQRRRIAEIYQRKSEILDEMEKLELMVEENERRIFQIDEKELRKELGELDDDKTAARTVITKHSACRTSKKVMSEAIRIDPELAIFDDTNSNEILEELLKIIANKYSEQNKLNSELRGNIQNIIEKMKGRVSQSKYEIPPQYLLEAIKHSIKDYCSGIIDDWYKLAVDYIQMYERVDGRIDVHLAETLLKLYNDKDNELGIIPFSTKKSDDFDLSKTLNDCFENGLKYEPSTNEKALPPCISDKAMISHFSDYTFLDFLGIESDNALGYFIVQIPKRAIYKGYNTVLWGTDADIKNGEDGSIYLLPRNIKGFVRSNNDGLAGKQYIEKKNFFNDKKYAFHVFDYAVCKEIDAVQMHARDSEDVEI